MHHTNLSQIFQKFNSSPKGLTEIEAQKRLSKYGKNELKAQKKISTIILFLNQFKDLLVIVLIIAGLFSGLAGEWKDAGVILIIVLINAIIGFIQEFKAEKAIEALKKLVSPTARVIRNGQEKIINATLLVPGDIIILTEGDKISADAKLIEENELETQESALTGESIPVKKTIETNNNPENKATMLFMGTNISHGTGKAIVTKTGMETEFGQIAHLTTETKKDQSPLQKELFKIGLFVGKLTLVISVLLFLGGLLKGGTFIETFLFSTAVAVAAVPEGLPATITIALAMGVQRLAKQNAIVKQLASVETLGSTTVICSDKTGTLTKNEMTVKQIIADDLKISITGSGYNPLGAFHIKKQKLLISLSEKADNIYDEYIDSNLQELKKDYPEIYTSIELLAKVEILCNNAKLIKGKNKNWEIIGDPTEGALLTCAVKSGFNIEKITKENKKIYELPFDSERKLMSVISQNKNDKIYIYTKGSPTDLLNICTNYINNKGEVTHLTSEKKAMFLNENNNMAKKALRVLGLAYKETTPKTKYLQPAEEKELTFIGLVGMIDPPRPEVLNAVNLTKKAGIKTYIVTGDNGITAKAIGEQIGLASEKTKIIEGQKLEKLKETDLQKLFKKYEEIIFARVKPEHKMKIVSALKKNGEIVAVTGDGVNDAPALKRGDIGISMGLSGTDVSKEASNMVLADDSYSTIITAIKEGRAIYENLKKFVFYVFSCNTGELFTVLAGVFIGIPAPLTAILILCVDLGTDVLPALALGVDPSDPEIMNQKPRDPKEHIMKKNFIKRFIILGIIIGIIVTALYLYILKSNGWYFGDTLDKYDPIRIKASTVAFATLVLIQMANAFNSRSETKSIFSIGLLSNKWLFGAITISTLIVLMIVEIPFLQEFLHTTHLTSKEWSLVILASLSIIFIEETRKKFSKK